MSKKIPLTQSQFALVDDADFDRVNMHRWYCGKGHTTAYAARRVYIEGRRTIELMHRFIMEPPPSLEVDHINGDGLDNRRSNLRLATFTQQRRNRRMQRNNRYGYKGISKAGKRWEARITVNDHPVYLGRHDTPEQAARAYDEAARHYYGDFARLNFQERETK